MKSLARSEMLDDFPGGLNPALWNAREQRIGHETAKKIQVSRLGIEGV